MSKHDHCKLKTGAAEGIDKEAFESAAERLREAADKGLPLDDLMNAAGQAATRLREEAGLFSYQKAIHARRVLEGFDYVSTQFKDAPEYGIEALISGVNAAREGVQYNASSVQRALRQKYLGTFYDKLIQNDLFDFFESGKIDLEVAKELYALRSSDAKSVTGNKEAFEIAKIIKEAQAIAVGENTLAGGSITARDDYITRQSHDAFRMEREGFAAWQAKISQHLDWEKMALKFNVSSSEQRTAFLKEAYVGLTTGFRDKGGSSGTKAFSMGRDASGRLAADRVFEFKSAEDWYSYNQEFGKGNLRESVIAGLDSLAETTGLMHVFGPTPDEAIDEIIDQIKVARKDEGDLETIKKLEEAWRGKGEKGWLANRYNMVSGKANNPVSQTLARATSTISAVNSMTKLGGALLSQFNDLGVVGSVSRYHGESFFGGMKTALNELITRGDKGLKNSHLRGIGIFSDSMAASLAEAGSMDMHLSQKLRGIQNKFFRLNGQRWWSDSMRRAMGSMLSSHIADNAERAFADLHPKMQRGLKIYGIDADKWDLMRSAPRYKDQNGNFFITAESLQEIPLESVRAYADKMDPIYKGAKTEKARNARLEEIKFETETQYRTFIANETSFGALEPGVRTRAILYQGTDPGTPAGLLLRLMTQFKSFSVAYTDKVLGRAVYGSGENIGNLRGWRGMGRALAQMDDVGMKAGMLLMMTSLGYLSMSAKNLAKGLEPRDPTDPETWGAAFMQAGGAGLYGDFLFGSVFGANRFGGGPIESLAGPTASTAGDFFRLMSSVARGDDAQAEALRFGVNNTPFANLFYTRLVLNHAMLYGLQESINPGYLNRMQQRIKKDTGQEFWLPPG